MDRSYVDYSRGDGPPVGLIFVAVVMSGLCISASVFSDTTTEKPESPKPVAAKPVEHPYVVCRGKIVGIKWDVRPHPDYDVGRQEAHIIMIDRLGRHCEFFVYSTDDENLEEGNHVNLVMTDPEPDNKFRTREIVRIDQLYKREHYSSYGDLKTNGSF